MIILHSDLNNFYASVETVLNPSLKNEYLAVCGSEEDRHGIVLAKNEKAKKCGVVTGEPIWKARAKCPSLIIVPPHFEKYQQYSKAVKKIYMDYTDKIESFGLDECWLDVTESVRLFGDGETIAHTIKERVKSETGLTVSVGVSFNKTFAKLGSDMKKPDAVTVIEKEKFKEKIWHLGVDALLGVGKSNAQKLRQYKIETIGDLACAPKEFLEKNFGKNGLWMWECANGLECSPVSHVSYRATPKSIGHGVTCRENLTDKSSVWKVIYKLSLSIEDSLRKNKLLAGSVAIEIRNDKLETKQFCLQLGSPTHSAYEIAKKAYALFEQKYKPKNALCVRSVSVRTTNLKSEDCAEQMSFFDDETKKKKSETFRKTFCNLKEKFGSDVITYASLMGDLKLPRNAPSKSDLPHYK